MCGKQHYVWRIDHSVSFLAHRLGLLSGSLLVVPVQFDIQCRLPFPLALERIPCHCRLQHLNIAVTGLYLVDNLNSLNQSTVVSVIAITGVLSALASYNPFKR